MNLAFRSKRAQDKGRRIECFGRPRLSNGHGTANHCSANGCEPPNWTAQQDHQNMMDQLGIKALRPGPSGNEKAPNHANYDESTANPFPNLPDVLTLKNGKKVTTATEWKQRRPEIVEDFDREVLGRVPQMCPK